MACMDTDERIYSHMDDGDFMNELIQDMTEDELVVFVDTLRQIAEVEPTIEAEIDREGRLSV